MNYLRILEEKILERFEQEAKLRKELERKALLLIEERSNFLQNEINREMKNRNESLENFHKIIETDIPKIQENLRDEQNDMIDNDTNMINKINDEISKLIEFVMNEKRARDETEQALMEMLKAMLTSMKSQFENEKKQR